MADAAGEHRHDGGGLAEIELVEEQGVRLVTVTGELDVSNVGLLQDATFDLPNECLGLVVDLSATSYVDSAGLGLLFGLRRALQRRGQALQVVCPPACKARRVLDLTGFAAQSTDDDREAAIANVHAAVPLNGSA